MRSAAWWCWFALVSALPAHGQYRPPRAADYLFAASVWDARALWVNPAGLAVVPEASITGEIVLDRLIDGDLALGQWGAGFNSRGLAFAFRRDRLTDTLSTTTFRVGAARGVDRIALGAAVTLHTNADLPADYEVDLGVRYLVARRIEVGATIQHLGRPTAIDSLLAITLTAGVAWRPLRGVTVATEVQSADRVQGSGVLNRYRAGLEIILGHAVPVAVFGVGELDHDFDLARFAAGVSVGGVRRGILLATDRIGDGGLRVETLSLAGLAINPLNQDGGRR